MLLGHRASCSPCGTSSKRWFRRVASATRWAATVPASRPRDLRQAHPGLGVWLRLPPHRRRLLLGDHAAPPPRRVDRLGPGRAAPPARPGGLRAAARLGARAPRDRRLYHQGARWRPGRRAQPGRPPQQGLKRSVACEAAGIPLAAVPAPANRRDDVLLAATLDTAAATLTAVQGPRWLLPDPPTVHLGAGSDYQPCRQALADRGLRGEIATRGAPAPVQAAAAG